MAKLIFEVLITLRKLSSQIMEIRNELRKIGREKEADLTFLNLRNLATKLNDEVNKLRIHR